MSNIIPYQAPQPQAVQQWRGVRPTDMDSAVRMATAIAKSGLLPKTYYDAGDPIAGCFVALQLGAEVGLSPMASVQNIAVINGRPGLFGPAQLAVVEASGKLADIEEFLEGDGDARKAVCIVQRIGRKPRRAEFSVTDAKRAGLWDKRGKGGGPGPWQQYPDRMLAARARSFILRDVFPDVLLGLGYSVEELRDIPADGMTTVEHDDAPPPPPAAAAPAEAAATVKPPLEVVLGGGWEPAKFPRGKRGLREALEFMTGAVVDGKPQIVGLNVALLDQIAQHLPDLAEEVADLRAAAAEAMAAADDAALSDPDAIEAEDNDEFPGDLPSRGDSGE